MTRLCVCVFFFSGTEAKWNKTPLFEYPKASFYDNRILVKYSTSCYTSENSPFTFVCLICGVSTLTETVGVISVYACILCTHIFAFIIRIMCMCCICPSLFLLLIPTWICAFSFLLSFYSFSFCMRVCVTFIHYDHPLKNLFSLSSFFFLSFLNL